jgi:hypothetical protein
MERRLGSQPDAFGDKRYSLVKNVFWVIGCVMLGLGGLFLLLVVGFFVSCATSSNCMGG